LKQGVFDAVLARAASERCQLWHLAGQQWRQPKKVEQVEGWGYHPLPGMSQLHRIREYASASVTRIVDTCYHVKFITQNISYILPFTY
jgi:hypothetical protein